MDISKIKELLELVENSSLTEFSLREGEDEIHLVKNMVVPAAAAIPKMEEKKEEPVSEEEDYIMSPMVGTFYNSASPDALQFVNVGDVVKAGEPLCIIEAMKLMNEIDCEFDAEILSIMVSNEQKVEYGQPLFKVKRL